VGSDVQAAVRFGSGEWPQLHVEKVLDEWLVPVCSKELLAKHGPIRTKDDLRRIPLLHSLSEPWNEWPDITIASENWGSRGSAFDDSVTVLRAAEAGQGFALARWSLAYQSIQDGDWRLRARVGACAAVVLLRVSAELYRTREGGRSANGCSARLRAAPQPDFSSSGVVARAR
jgi:DNA-binding transcriptional LysR family regulator